MYAYDFEKCLKEMNGDLCALCCADECDEDNNCPYDGLKGFSDCPGFDCEERCRYCSPKCPHNVAQK
jgi:hypothetical protein